MTKRKAQSRAVPTVSDPNERILSTTELLEKIPLHRATIYRMVQEGRFPRPVQLTRSRIGWRWSAVLNWLEKREAHPEAPRAFFGRNRGPDHPLSP